MAEQIKIDDIDKKILQLLKHNARIQWREIGEEIHMTGQAVGDRIRKLKKAGIITGFSTDIDYSSIVDISVDYITIIMSSSDHKGFLNFVESNTYVTEIYRTSGYGCYMLRLETATKSELEAFLEKIVAYGNYQVSSVIAKYR